jgi:L-asparaginase / beta-aspartyl-peptidase
MSIVVVHGGVQGIAKDEAPSLSYAVEAGRKAPNAVDAVELAVCALEDDPTLNAACGAVLNSDGRLELDAGIADGSAGRCGGIANVAVRHPISLARRVLDETPHVLITGAGAIALGADMEQLGGPTEAQRLRWEQARDQGKLGPDHYATPEQVDTVGAIALDDEGHLAAGSSTGGVFGKLPGRVGDSPMFGAGFYASEKAAVVGTGVGELFIELLAAYRVGVLIERGMDPQHACNEILELLVARTGEAAGLLALDSRGRVGAAFNGGSWAVAGPDGPIQATKTTA